MSALNLALLGQFEGSLDGKPLGRFRTLRAQALLVYLTTEFALGASHQGREALMELLWPGMPPDSARTNLRQNLYYLRQTVPNASAPEGGKAIPFLLSERQAVAINPHYPVEIDVQKFGDLLAQPKEAWPQAAALYRGDFLSDFYLADANPFEEWAAARREAFRRQVLNVLEGLTNALVEQDHLKDAEGYARRQLAIDPLRETAYRQLMKVLYWSGRRAEALILYQECIRVLEDELDAPPSEATTTLAEAIREGSLAERSEMQDPGEGAGVEIGFDKTESSVTREQISEATPLAEQAATIRNNLPAETTPFIGRERELPALAKLLSDPQVRIITVIGPGGIGKTRLALEAADQELHPFSPFPDGIFFVPLAPLDSAEEMMSALASALDFSFQHDGQTPRSEREQLLEYLGRKEMLLVMDNFEHILEGRTLLVEIGKWAPTVKLLITSRERLQIQGEQLFFVRGLEMPPPDESAEEAVIDYAAAKLFLNASRRTVPGFEILEGDAEQIARICRLVEGMPLGLELAASWSGLLPLSAIAEEIEQSMELLSSEHHDIPMRHRSMQATLEVSWKRLTPDQKLAFQQLTIFRGGLSREAAQNVAGAGLPILAALVNKSWLSYDRNIDRYHIHELLRQYGMSKLKTETKLEQEVRKRHSTFYCGYLKERETDWFGPRQQEAAAEVRSEIENIQSAWRWAASQGDVLLLAQGYTSLGRYYSWKVRRADGKQAFKTAADRLGQSLAQVEAEDPQSLTLWSQILAWQADFTDEVDRKQRLLAQSQDILDSVTITGRDTRAEQAFVFLEQALATEKRDYEASIGYSNLALELFRELGDLEGEARALRELGLNYRRQGKFEEAYDVFRKNLDIRKQLEDPLGIADALLWLGQVTAERGNPKEGELLFRQALTLFRQLGHRYHEAGTMSAIMFVIGGVEGRILDAKDIIEQALTLERESGQTYNLWIHFAAADCYLHLGHYTKALSETNEALEIAQKRGLIEETGAGLGLQGDIAFGQGDLEGAKAYYQESATVLTEGQDVHKIYPMALLGYVAYAQGDDSLARDCLRDTLLTEAGYGYHDLARFVLPLAALLAADDAHEEWAMELYGRAQQYGIIKHSLWWDAIACRELNEIRASLPQEVAAAAEARGREIDLGETIDKLLADLSP